MKMLSVLFFCLMFVSCGESPLLNHKMEKGNFVTQNLPATVDGHRLAQINYSFNVDWLVGPLKGESKFLIKAWDDRLGTANGPYKDFPETLNVFIWMPDMGHGSAPVKVTKIDQGEYEVSNVYFIMGGTWELHFQILKNAKVVDEVIIPVTL